MKEKGQIFQKKTIEAAINTIMTKMDELKGANESDKNIMRRRWIWELMQNANDCANENEISIWINSNKNELVFSHNGDIFTYDNLIDLITQISSKRVNEDKTGKFGTGFISTHLISEIVKIKGIYHRTKTSNNYKSMCFNVDRSGETEQEIKDSITTAISELETIDISENVECDFDSDKPKTAFVYDLTRKSSFEVQEAITSGFKDLDMSIAFVLAFTKYIKEVHCDSVTYKRNRTSLINDSLEVIDVVKSYDDGHKGPEIKQILVCTDKTNEVSVAIIIECRENNYYTCTMKDVPKLFCTFPLIGTENFSFPVVLNSPKLKVLQERNHIQEGAEINREIIDIAISLYERMLDYACGNEWNNLYNICYMNNSKESPWQKTIFERVESIYQIRPVVDVQAKAGQMSKESLYTVVNGQLKHNIFMPSMEKKELNDWLWDIINCLHIKWIPTKESFKHWLAIAPNNRITLQMIYNHLLKDKITSDLSQWLKDKTEVVPWLNGLYDLWINSSDERNFKATAIVPNQNGQFVEITKVAIDNNIDGVLKEILTLLGTDIKSKLMYKGIEIIKSIEMNSYNNEYVANKISDYIRKQLSDESSNTIKRTTEVQNIFNALTDWFLKNPDLAKTLFKDIYDKQHLLSSPEETIRRLDIASSVESAMNENNIELEQLSIVLKESGRLLQLFQNGEISLSEEAKELFQHISSKSLYAKEKLDSLIDRSICSVHKELVDNSRYTVDESLEEWKQNKYSTTVFKAKKENKDIRIVIRPSDGDKIIFYEDAEIEALDDTDYELWTDNGEGIVRMITLGDLIKTTGISVIPFRKIL